MNSKNIVFFGGIWLFLLVFQAIFPSFHFRGVFIQPDLLLVLLTYVALSRGGAVAVLFGFTNGLIQDLTTQASLIGILTLSKSVAAYLLYFLNNYKSVWTRKLKLLWIFGVYFIHFLIYGYFYLRGKELGMAVGLNTILIHSVISFSVYLLFERLLGKSRLI